MVLHGALAGAAVGILPAGALAQAPAAAASHAALGAPRLALVIGNDRYRDAPLKNPVNDARAIAVELESADFAVSLLLDATLGEMRARVEDFGRELARTRGVGLFYFAGHGIQLSWRNYLLPVDTVIQKLDEVRDKAVDLALLLESMGKAGNPANIVILDACRNNPFGRDFRVEQRGLSQVDAPVGTLLAYATAPGNVAIDGEGANGLYTENLLREIRVPDAKVEDIFKRVRLAVRRASKGVQIPWESTSLEEDFYFQLPDELRKTIESDRAKRVEAEREAIRREDERQRQVEAELRAKKVADDELQRRLAEERAAARRAEEDRRRKAAAEIAARQRADAERRRLLEAARLEKERDDAARQRAFDAQLAAWEGLQKSSDPAAFAEFLYRYPSGSFSELAQLRLDRLLAQAGEKRVEIVNAPENPYTKGTARADIGFKLGDNYVYRVIDRYTGNEVRRINQTVTAINDMEVVFNQGRLILDLLGNLVQTPGGIRFFGRQDQPLEYAVGKKWSTRYRTTKGEGEGDQEFDFRIVGREKVTVPAGTFDCFKVAGSGVGRNFRGGQARFELTYWAAPAQVRRPIAMETDRRVYGAGGRERVLSFDRTELLSFRQA